MVSLQSAALQRSNFTSPKPKPLQSSGLTSKAPATAPTGTDQFQSLSSQSLTLNKDKYSHSSIANLVIASMYQQRKAALKSDLLKDLEKQGIKNDKKAQTLVNLVVESQDFQQDYKMGILQTLKQHPKLSKMLQQAITTQRKPLTAGKASVKFGMDSDEDETIFGIPTPQTMVRRSVRGAMNDMRTIARTNATGAMDDLVDPASSAGARIINNIANNTLTAHNRRVLSNFVGTAFAEGLDQGLQDAEARIKERYTQKIKKALKDNAIPLSMVASGAMLPGTFGQAVAAGGVQLLLPEPREPLTDIGLGSAVTIAGNALKSPVLTGAGLLRGLFGVPESSSENDNTQTAVFVGSLLSMLAAGYLLPESLAADSLTVGALSFATATLGYGVSEKLKDN